jgi:hypothetical protein
MSAFRFQVSGAHVSGTSRRVSSHRHHQSYGCYLGDGECRFDVNARFDLPITRSPTMTHITTAVCVGALSAAHAVTSSSAGRLSTELETASLRDSRWVARSGV